MIVPCLLELWFCSRGVPVEEGSLVFVKTAVEQRKSVVGLLDFAISRHACRTSLVRKFFHARTQQIRRSNRRGGSSLSQRTETGLMTTFHALNIMKTNAANCGKCCGNSSRISTTSIFSRFFFACSKSSRTTPLGGAL